MCGRFVLTDDKDKILHTYGIELSEINLTPRYNIYPSERIPVVFKEDGLCILKKMEWGLKHFLSKKPKPIINSRIESLIEKSSFYSSLCNRRCIVPANGFFEWAKKKSGKQPYFISLKNKKTISFAGLWRSWVTLEGETRETVSILTTEANSFMKKIHHRMPVILTNKNFAEWLDFQDVSLKNFTSTCEPEQMQAWKVSKEVNVPTFDNPNCIKKLFSSGKNSNDFCTDQIQASLLD